MLAERFNGPTVVISHHAPLERSLQTGKQECPLDAAYASDLSQMIEKYAPDLWLHGHIHTSHDYVYADTRIMTNPRGYLLGRRMHGRGELRPENPAFDSALIIEVEPRPKSTIDLKMR